MACAVSELFLKQGKFSCLNLESIALFTEERWQVKWAQTLVGPEKKSWSCPSIQEPILEQKFQLSLGQSENRENLGSLSWAKAVKTQGSPKKNGHKGTSSQSYKVNKEVVG